jgi:hypothetical protein
MFTSCTKTSSANEQNRMLMSHTLCCSNMHPLLFMSTVTQSISLAALSMTVNTNQPLSHSIHYMQHTQTHYNTSVCYIIIDTHASNIWSCAAFKTFYCFCYLTEDYGYFSARHWAYQYNTTTNAIHTLLDLAWAAELHVTLVTSRSWSHGLSHTST